MPDTNILQELKDIAISKVPECPFKVAMAKIANKDEAEQIEQALMTGAFSYSIISEFFKRRDIRVSNDAMGEHKRGTCRCQRKTL